MVAQNDRFRPTGVRLLLHGRLDRFAIADAIAALQRCEHCLYQNLCDELLATPGHGGNRSFCPAAPYVESLREGELKF